MHDSVVFKIFGLEVTNVIVASWVIMLLLVVGPTYQPSEVAKLGIVLVFAAGMSKRNGR